MEKEHTERGFDIYYFKDRYGYMCSIQKSSLATEDCIWLGINEQIVQILAKDAIKAELHTKESNGWVDLELPKGSVVINRMHLTQDQVKELLPILQKFVETGEI